MSKRSTLTQTWHPREVVLITEGSVVPTDIVTFVQEVGGTVKGCAFCEDWKQAGYNTLTLETIKIDHLLKNPSAFELVDVRTEEKWLKRHIHGSRNIPLSKLNLLAHELNTAKKYVASCAGVYRGIAGAAKLRAQGLDVLYLPDGVNAWEKLGGQTEGVRAYDGNQKTGVDTSYGSQPLPWCNDRIVADRPAAPTRLSFA